MPNWWTQKFGDPVVRLVRALYGHPDSGGYWEQKCSDGLKKCGFERIDEAYNSLWYNKKRDCLLMVYVDDFKMAGTLANMKKCWADIDQQAYRT